MKQINTFSTPKIEGTYTHPRIGYTINFLKDCKKYVVVLDIGEKNLPDKIIASHFDHVLINTQGNLDETGWNKDLPKFKYIYCFEVMEHLLNPLLFLEEVKKVMQPDSKLFISVPFHTHRRYWNNSHWHEMDIERLNYLFDVAGLKVLRFDKRYSYKTVSIGKSVELLSGKRKFQGVWAHFKKIKPIIRTTHYYFELEYK